MEKLTEIFKKFKPVDLIIVAGVILALIVGFLHTKILDKQHQSKLKRLQKLRFKFL